MREVEGEKGVFCLDVAQQVPRRSDDRVSGMRSTDTDGEVRHLQHLQTGGGVSSFGITTFVDPDNQVL